MQAIALKDGLAQRLGGPGGLYNLGNGLGLLGGVSFHVAAASGTGWAALMLGLGLVLIGHPVLAAVLMDPNAAVGVADLEGAAASGLLVLCYGLWLKADVALMRG